MIAVESVTTPSRLQDHLTFDVSGPAVGGGSLNLKLHFPPTDAGGNEVTVRFQTRIDNGESQFAEDARTLRGEPATFAATMQLPPDAKEAWVRMLIYSGARYCGGMVRTVVLGVEPAFRR